MKYKFLKIDNCNMCGRETSNNILLGQRLNTSQGRNPKSKSGISTSVFKCSKCSFIYPNPLPIPDDIQDHYGIIPENYWMPEYFNVNPNYFLAEINDAKRLIEFKQGMKSLDIGAGIGKCMNALKNAGFDAYGLEPSLLFRKKAIEEMSINENKIQLNTVETADYPENTFDFISFGAVLEHLYNPANCIEIALKWLKPNGVIYIEVPNSNWFNAKILNFYYRIRGTNYVTHISPMHSPFHIYEFAEKSFVELSKRLNFLIAFSQIHVATIYGLPKLFHPLLRLYMKQTKSGSMLDVWLRKKN